MPRQAHYCGYCGSDDLSGPGVERRPWGVGIRLLLLSGGAFLAILLFRGSVPAIRALWAECLGAIYVVVVYAVIFLMVTGLLPEPWGSIARKTASRLVSFIGRLIAGIFR